MFSEQSMSVLDWWVYFILLMIPVVNVVLFIMILLSPTANRSVRSFEYALILPILFIGLYIVLNGVPQGFNGPF